MYPPLRPQHLAKFSAAASGRSLQMKASPEPPTCAQHLAVSGSGPSSSLSALQSRSYVHVWRAERGAPTESAPGLGSAEVSATKARRMVVVAFIVKMMMEELQWFCWLVLVGKSR